MVRKNIICLLLSFVAATSWAQQLPQVSSTIAADTIWIGDQTQYIIDIRKDISTEIGLPQFKDNKLTEQIEIVAGPWVDTVSVRDRELEISVKYLITSFDAGEYVLQGFPLLAGTDTLKTQTVNHLVVKTFEIDTTKQEIFDIKENINTPITWAEVKEFILSWRGAAVLGGFAILAALIWLAIWFSRRRKDEAEKPKEPAHIIALRAFLALEKKKMWESGQVKEYYSVLTDIIRNYIDDRYGVSTMELTTPEILALVKDLNSEKPYSLLEGLLFDADLVKFAKMIPSPEENIESLEKAREYVEETKLIIIDPENEENN